MVTAKSVMFNLSVPGIEELRDEKLIFSHGNRVSIVPWENYKPSLCNGNFFVRKVIILAFVVSAIWYFLWETRTITIGQSIEGYPSDKLAHTRVNESQLVCSEVFTDNRTFIQNQPQHHYEKLPIIYFVTPTFPRREQIPELIRLSHTLLHVPRIHWIIANDQYTCNAYLDSFLNKLGIPITHLTSPMPEFYRKKKPMPRGVSNRRAALKWIQRRNITDGILYFGDDDNTYDLKLFSEVRDTQKVSMFPVGLIEEYSISGPVVRMGKVVGFLDSWVAQRRWPVDMAGFATNLAYMAEHPNASMPYKPGHEEDLFLRSIKLEMSIIEPKASNCTEILVWHTQTKSRDRSILKIKNMYLDDRSNLGSLFKSLKLLGVVITSDIEGQRTFISINGKAKPVSYFLS
ncbi:galactosylgalactosylxylosylprotein 3-beta-glucuronosyltransferase S [Eurosta solidaginis]|uniref:galactosylgalactosylxylosylprotein 3-beta-glucuronosyltransferase S n=1 Tax=Eurosta solidaginis TaxID=178769 RepID=UPI003530778B